MTSAAMLSKLEVALGGSTLGLTDIQCYANLTSSKNRIEQKTSCSVRKKVPIVNTAAQETFDLTDEAVINIDTGSTILEVNNLWWSDVLLTNMQRRTAADIDKMRAVCSRTNIVLEYWATHRTSSGLVLEVYPQISTAYTSFSTAKLKADLKLQTRDISADNDPESPDYASDAIIFDAAYSIALWRAPSLRGQLYKDRVDALNLVKHISNSESSD